MENFSFEYALVIFFGTIASDIAYVFYVRRVAGGDALSAAALGSLIALVGAILVVTYIENKIYIIPLAFGSFVGTYVAINFDTKSKRFMLGLSWHYKSIISKGLFSNRKFRRRKKT